MCLNQINTPITSLSQLQALDFLTLNPIGAVSAFVAIVPSTGLWASLTFIASYQSSHLISIITL